MRLITREIKLMPDYDCWPLWACGSEVGNLDPADLPLRPATCLALAAWAAVYDSWLNREDPANSPGQLPAELEAFETEGPRLWHVLRQELGPAYQVTYFSHLQNRLLSKPDMGE